MTKVQLAAHLGRSAESLISRHEVASRTGLTYSYLTKLSDQGPGYYREDGGICYYPIEFVDAYNAERRNKVRFEWKAGVNLGRIPIPVEPVRKVVPVHVVVGVIERWKRRELYRRAQTVFDDFLSDQRELKNELRLFGEPWNGDRLDALSKILDGDDNARARKDIFDSMDEQSREVTKKLREVCDEAEIFPSFVHSSFQILSNLMEAAWRDVVVIERRWRTTTDYSGMPLEKPD